MLDGPRTNGKPALLAAAGKQADRQEVVAQTGPHDRLERLTNDPHRNPPCSSPPHAAATITPQPRSLTSRVDQDRLPDPGRPLEAATSSRRRQHPQEHDRSLKARTRAQQAPRTLILAGAASSWMPENIGSDYRCEPRAPLPPCTRGRARNRTVSAGARGGRADQRPYPSLDRTRAAVPRLARAREHARAATPRAQHRSHRRRREAGGPTMTHPARATGQRPRAARSPARWQRSAGRATTTRRPRSAGKTAGRLQPRRRSRWPVAVASRSAGRTPISRPARIQGPSAAVPCARSEQTARANLWDGRDAYQSEPVRGRERFHRAGQLGRRDAQYRGHRRTRPAHQMAARRFRG